MPRDSNSVYSLPPGLTAISGEDALAEQINTPLADIASALTGSLARNGSGAMTANLPMGGFKVTDAATATDATDLITKGQVDTAIAAAAIAVGIVSPFAGATAPSGWLLCNGQAVSRTTYAALFAIVATTYGTGDGSTTFNVPDLRGEFIRGLDASRGIDGGRALGSAQSADIAAHNHTATSTVTDPGHEHDILTSVQLLAAGGGAIGSFGATPGTSTDTATTGITVATTVANSTGTETRPRNIALNFIIKT